MSGFKLQPRWIALCLLVSPFGYLFYLYPTMFFAFLVIAGVCIGVGALSCMAAYLVHVIKYNKFNIWEE